MGYDKQITKCDNPKAIGNITKYRLFEKWTSAKLINNETCELIYTDNGKGIKKIENKEGHLGLNIIQSLTKQINGTLEINTPEKGSRFKIIFPIKEDTCDIQNNKFHN